MKRIFSLILIIAIILMSGASNADTALKKLGRGAANVVTCPIEIVYRIGEVNKEDGPIAAYTWGLLNGIWRTGVRVVVGVYEVITFPLPLPKNYEPIIDDPEFFLNEGLF
jgi:putative exosortase-associated protein (TIGR04073 family)